jgi:hypothetical protein
MTTFTTGEAAHQLSVSRQSLHAWIRSQKIEAPPMVRFGICGRARLWTEADIRAVRVWHRKYVPRRGRKPKAVDVAQIARLRAAGRSWRTIGKVFGVAPTTARRAAQ